jgi:hypothetical protein
MLQDATKLEFYSQKLDASLFAFGNHSKKRQGNKTVYFLATEMVRVSSGSCKIGQEMLFIFVALVDCIPNVRWVTYIRYSFIFLLSLHG